MGRAMLRAAMCRRGPEDALANALRAVVLDRPGSRWRDLALWTVALARTALGDPTGADAALALAVASAHANRNAGLAWCLLGHRALLAADRLDWAAAEAFLDEGHALTPPAITDAFASATPALAAMARLRAHQGHVTRRTRLLRQALVVRPALTAASPVLSVSPSPASRAPTSPSQTHRTRPSSLPRPGRSCGSGRGWASWARR